MGRIIRGSPLAAVAIGGINEGNLADVRRHGAVNFCVLRAVNQAADPAGAIRRLQEIWEVSAS
jgi:thiamine monophosphate synthase